MSPFFRPSAIALCALSLAACAVGPDFKQPTSPEASRFTPDPLPLETASTDGTAGAKQRFLPTVDVSTAWWEEFHSESLNSLILAAFEKNPDLEAAKAAFRVAQEDLKAGEGSFYPAISGSLGTSRNKSSAASAGVSDLSLPSFSLYNAAVSVSYPLDIFGGIQRNVEALQATEESQKLAYDAARITLAGNIVTTVIQEANLRAQIDATKEIIATEEKQRDLLKRQLELGAVTKAALLAEEATLAATKAGLPSLFKELEQNRHLLAVLAGQVPSERIEANFSLDKLYLPEDLPLTVPSQLLTQRPDIKAVEAQMKAANAAIGVAEANRYPQITLSGNFGVDALQIGQMFNTGAAAWSLGGALLQPLFEGGKLEHKQRSAEAAYDKVFAQYKSTVLSAFQDVADALRALQADAATLKARNQAEQTAKESLDLASEQFKAGSVSYLTLLNAEQTWQQAKIALAQARAQRFADTAALYVALGGGWKSPASAPTSSKKGE